MSTDERLRFCAVIYARVNGSSALFAGEDQTQFEKRTQLWAYVGHAGGQRGGFCGNCRSGKGLAGLLTSNDRSGQRVRVVGFHPTMGYTTQVSVG